MTGTFDVTSSTITNATANYWANNGVAVGQTIAISSQKDLFLVTSITNNGDISAQLVSRHWIITDADNQVQEVRGMGVVGEQPVLKPGDTFEYSSGSSIPTAVGTMRGSYQLVAEDGTRFEASIPEFTLSVPRVLH